MHEVKARFPESVRNYLSTRARDNDRSMNAELINILKKAMKAEPLSPALLPEPKEEEGKAT